MDWKKVDTLVLQIEMSPIILKIEFIDSKYNGTYDIFGITTNTFKVSPVGRPESYSYSLTQLDSASYITKSSSALSGSVSRVTLLSDGLNVNNFLSLLILKVRMETMRTLLLSQLLLVKSRRLEYLMLDLNIPLIKLLDPEAFVAPVVKIDDVDTIDKIILNDGGSNYISAPNLILYNDTSNPDY